MNIYIPPNKCLYTLRFIETCLGIWPTDNQKWTCKNDYFFWFCILNYIVSILPLFYCLNVSAALYTWIEMSGVIKMMSALFVPTEQLLAIDKEKLSKNMPILIH
ncbi:hypothetical protein TSAR_003962 [Trichomalopsis sarcophagae]|uniref:Uncharacterized protein n=1 Tax=Trichomalopsis sarcophagae TaxID=543379 RepID=A0A232ESK4_9HYME|nr:hypothetical protein TSAR_003962 [Trichomalopsis sarcophagae]